MLFNITNDDDIVISGVSARLPKSEDVNEFAYNLYNKVDMLSEKSPRWTSDVFDGLPKRHGFVEGVEKFDATFFGIHSRQAHTMDPQCRMLLEQSYAAVMDAGIHPRELKGSNTAVFSASCASDTENYLIYQQVVGAEFGVFGCSRNMLANRISFFMDLHGPSYNLDSACSSSLFILNQAFEAINNGKCDAAIVCAANLLLLPNTSLSYGRLNILAPDGISQCFDENAHGYVRSDGIVAIFVQKRKDAKRVYATVAHTGVNNDGYKPQGITYPAGQMQQTLMESFYKEIDLDPRKVSYVEGHITGTQVGDPEECRALDNVFCRNDRNEPLLVGSVKSNAGHTEAAAGLCSVTKAILIMERGLIPPNLHYDNPRQSIAGLVEGRMQVVVENTPLPGPLIAINAFGFGGVNTHALLVQSNKSKINHGRPPNDNLPRLVTWSGRTEEAVDTVLKTLSSMPLDAEFVALLHNTQCRYDIEYNLYKGYGIYKANENPSKPAECIASDISYFDQMKRPVVWLYSGMGSQWIGMGKPFMGFQVFRDTIQRCHDVLVPFGMDLISVITSNDKTVFDSILNAFVGINAIQIALTNVLRALKIPVNHIIGHSMGETGCGYGDGTLTLEQACLGSYYRGKVSIDTETIDGSMAAVAMGFHEIQNKLPKEIFVACRNNSKSVTISGPKNDVKRYITQLKQNGIFAKEIECGNIAYHSRYIAAMSSPLLLNLKSVIPSPMKRSSKWLSTSVPQSEWTTAAAAEQSTYSSAEYYVNNLLSPVLFEDTIKLLPPNALILEIAPHSLLQSIVKHAMPDAKYFSLSKRGRDEPDFFLNSLGQLSLSSISAYIDNLYPPVSFPVSRGTPMIAPLIKWDHQQDWKVVQYDSKRKDVTCEQKLTISLSNDEYKYMAGHVIDDRCLVPGIAYLQFVREMLVGMIPAGSIDTISVEFENVHLMRATALNPSSAVNLLIVIHYASGRFEICENETAVAEGTIRCVKNPEPILDLKKQYVVESNSPILKQNDFYKELSLRGYKFKGLFRSVQECRADSTHSKIKWADNNWVTFMDNLLQTCILKKDSRSLYLPTRIRKIRINPLEHFQTLHKLDPRKPAVFDVYSSRDMNVVVGGGIEISGVDVTEVTRRKTNGTDVFETYEFVPLNCVDVLHTVHNGARICIQLALEKLCTRDVKFVEVLTSSGDQKPNIGYFQKAFNETMLVVPDLFVLTENTFDNFNNVHFKKGPLTIETDCTFILAANCIGDKEFLADVEQSLSKTGYLILIENIVLFWDDIKVPKGFQLISAVKTTDNTMILLQRENLVKSENVKMIHVNSNNTNFEWLDIVNRDSKENKVILIENDEFSGLIGLTNCLRLEPGFEDIRCVAVVDSCPSFDFSTDNNKTLASHLALDLPINVYKNGNWGTYRHLLIDQELKDKQHGEHIYLKIQRPGDLSTLKWISGPLGRKNYKKKINVQYASLNFRDVMLATGRLPSEFYINNRLDPESCVGIEYAGLMHDQTRVMGMSLDALTTQIDCDAVTLWWKVPDTMSLRDAATIPVVYITVYLAFFVYKKISKGNTCLIHAGSGGVGLAAIRVALSYGLTVFTTVSTEEKKKYMLNLFPALKESNIGNSRNCSFENMVMLGTNGKGVDFVLNSLSGEKFLASFRCLRKGGTFLELGKFDMINNTNIGMGLFDRETVFRVVSAEILKKRPAIAKIIRDLINRDLESGLIQPLQSTLFQMNEIENAFRYLSTGKHIGKVVIQIRNNEKSLLSMPVRVFPLCYFNPDMTYIVVGGLGGFGLELVDWLVIRGARILVLSSRRGISTGYQAYKIELWKSYGCRVIINTSEDVTNTDGCKQLLTESASHGQIGGIFNLAVVLRDKIFENQTSANFVECYAPKVLATLNLDELSRRLCPKLKYFVVFSSVACGRGNAGQTNYGLSNSIMERIIEKRIREKLPGKAIQWGAIGDVGIIAENMKINSSLMGALPQPIESCLNVMDLLLHNEQPVVSSMIVAHKQRIEKVDAFNSVLNIIGISDVKSISINSTLSELGMDSLMSVEIKQVLEREFGIIKTAQELRVLSVEQLQQISYGIQRQNEERNVKLMALFQGLKNLGDEKLCTQTLVKLPSNYIEGERDKLTLIVPGIESVVSDDIRKLCTKINESTFVLQLHNCFEKKALPDLVSHVIGDVKQLYQGKRKFHVIGYSFGAVIATEITRELEKLGLHGNLTIIDGSLPLFKKFINKFKYSKSTYEQENDQLAIIMLPFFVNDDQKLNFETELAKKIDLNEKLNICVNYLADINYSKDYLKAILRAAYNRVDLLRHAEILLDPKIKSPITLVRPNKSLFNDIEDDYELSQFSINKVNVKYIDGNHQTILSNETLAVIINES